LMILQEPTSINNSSTTSLASACNPAMFARVAATLAATRGDCDFFERKTTICLAVKHFINYLCGPFLKKQ
jgi:hypothetical protein